MTTSEVTIHQLVRDLTAILNQLSDLEYREFTFEALRDIVAFYDDRLDEASKGLARETMQLLGGGVPASRKRAGELSDAWITISQSPERVSTRPVARLCVAFANAVAEFAGLSTTRDIAIPSVFDSPMYVPTNYGTFRRDRTVRADLNSPETRLLLGLTAKVRHLS